jgi:hypothetical protein
MTMPSAESYGKLIAALREAKAALPKKPTETDEEARERQIDGGLHALRMVMAYLLADDDVRDGLLTQPLAVLEAAVHNAAKGAKPVLLNPPPPLIDGDRSRRGKASRTANEDVQAFLAFAVKPRMLESKTLHTAAPAEWVARQAAKHGMKCENGAPVVRQQVKNWYEQAIRKKLPAGAETTFNNLEKMHGLLLHPATVRALGLDVDDTTRRELCGIRAVAIIEACAALNPFSAPNPTARLKTKAASS